MGTGSASSEAVSSPQSSSESLWGMLPTLNSKSTASQLFVQQEEAWLARLAAPAAHRSSMPQCHGQHIQCMEFALQTEQQGKGSLTELLLHELQAEPPPFTGDYASWGPTATQDASSSPTHPWGAKEGCYGLRRDLPGAGGAEPTAGCTMQLVPTSPAATWGGADASTVRHREEMCCCWRNFKLGKHWDPSSRPCGDRSLTWPCCSTSEPQTRCESPIPATPDTAGPCGWQQEGLPSPS